MKALKITSGDWADDSILHDVLANDCSDNEIDNNLMLIAAAPDLGEYARCEYEFAAYEEFTTGGKEYYQHYAVAKLREMRLEALLKAGYAE